MSTILERPTGASSSVRSKQHISQASISTFLNDANAVQSGAGSSSNATDDQVIGEPAPQELYKMLVGSSDVPVLFAWWPTVAKWCHDELSERCTRGLPAVRPQTDLIALPRFDEVEELWSLWAEQHGMAEWQAVWFDPFPRCGTTYLEPVATPPEAAFADVIAGLPRCVERKDLVFYPMYLTVEMSSACARYGLTAVGDAADHPICPLGSAKAWLHPHVDPQKRGSSLRESLPLRTAGAAAARGPVGYVASSGPELMLAMRKLRSELPHGSRLVLKPSWASGGDGIVINVTEAELAAFEFPSGQTAILEEFVAGSGMSPTLYMIGGEPCALLADQLLSRDGVVNDGNRWPSPTASEGLTQTCIAAAREIQKAWGLKSQWGLDFVVDQSGVPIVVDLNMGRPNGNFSVRLWESCFCQRLYLHTSSWTPPVGVAAGTFFRALREDGLAWDPAVLEGVLVYQHFQGRSSAYVVASADSWGSVDAILVRLREVFTKICAAARLKGSGTA